MGRKARFSSLKSLGGGGPKSPAGAAPCCLRNPEHGRVPFLRLLQHFAATGQDLVLVGVLL